ncbi:hypothetical protein OG982_30060 [Streptomyces sp. NBC_01551]|uniref:hypothetical protein n=1 Tax=Streptomyces sp. NBC_01551 TaxID=2975876 RepID=UPI00225B9C33|nr:hypothetical protein [Streptomyces sp. NBC_01551]MCX4529889.1 hypothetical protein [Streptomyces sp. NBC_01551]
MESRSPGSGRAGAQARAARWASATDAACCCWYCAMIVSVSLRLVPARRGPLGGGGLLGGPNGQVLVGEVTVGALLSGG